MEQKKGLIHTIWRSSDGAELTKDVPENSTWDPCCPCWNDTLLLKADCAFVKLLGLQKEERNINYFNENIYEKFKSFFCLYYLHSLKKKNQKSTYSPLCRLQ